MSTSSGMSRRGFLGSIGCAALTSTPLLSTLLNMNLIGRASAQTTSDYKAIVCLFLQGGCDSFNLVLPSPAETAAYGRYSTLRGNSYKLNTGGLALPPEEILSLSPLGHSGPGLGIHHKMPFLRALFNQNVADLTGTGESTLPAKAAIVANVGTLMREGTNARNWQDSDRQPYGLFSHNDQQLQWQTTLRNAREATGWAGLMQDIIYSTTSVPWAANISMGQINTLQTGGLTDSGGIGSRPFVLNGTDVAVITPQYTDFNGVAVGGKYGAHYTQSVKKLVPNASIDSSLRDGKAGILSRVFQDIVSQTVANADELKAALSASASSATTIDTIFNGRTKPLENSLKSVAKLIASSGALSGNISRQTFFVPYSGWDHHDEVVNNMAGMLPQMDSAIYFFFKALSALGLQNKVTLFVCSDFGRTLGSNGKGSDHAWGSNMLVVGGAVQGRRIFGTYPDFANTSLIPNPGATITDASIDSSGRGRLIPTTSADQYFATLAKWMGVSDADLPSLFPALGGFSTPTLGFV